MEAQGPKDSSEEEGGRGGCAFFSPNTLAAATPPLVIFITFRTVTITTSSTIISSSSSDCPLKICYGTGNVLSILYTLCPLLISTALKIDAPVTPLMAIEARANKR